MCKRLDHPAVHHAKTTRAIGDRQPAEHADQRAENPNAHQPAHRLLVLPIAQKSRTHDHVSIGLDQMIDQPTNLAGAVLTVAVHLNGNVIPMQSGVAKTGLHCAADTKIKWQADHRCMSGHLAKGVVRRAIVDDKHIKIRKRPLQAVGEFTNRLPFIERGHDDQAA